MTLGASGDAAAGILGVWEEVRGVVETVELVEQQVLITISSETVVLPANASNRAATEAQWSELEGEYVSILRTETIDNPYRIAIGEVQTDDQSCSGSISAGD